jgi:hypothetical protein
MRHFPYEQYEPAVVDAKPEIYSNYRSHEIDELVTFLELDTAQAKFGPNVLAGVVSALVQIDLLPINKDTV